jgi:hypothetical protein
MAQMRDRGRDRRRSAAEGLRQVESLGMQPDATGLGAICFRSPTELAG